MRILRAIVAWSLSHRPIVLLATLIFVALGAGASVALPIDAVPDVTNIQVQIITAAPALSPVEVEQYVTVPVERAVAGTPRVTEIRSISKYGLSVVTVVFTDDTDIYFARQLLSERMREAQEAVPSMYGEPAMGPISTGLGEVYQFTVENSALSLMQREELLDWYIGPALRTVPGIVEVNSFGGEDKQYQVVVDPKRLQAAGVSIAEVAAALQKSNANAGGGYIEHNREHFVIGTDGLIKSLDDLNRVVIGATKEGIPITVSTVADVQLGPRLRRGASSKDGQGETVLGVALMLMGENSRTVTEAVKLKLAELQPSLPKGTQIVPFYDRSKLVDRTIHTVGKNMLEGAALVMLVLFVLLGEIRGGLVVAVTIPLSMLFALGVMKALGLSGNLMSLGAIDFGLIVDGAVIIVENAVRKLSEKNRMGKQTLRERIDTVRDATLEVQGATVFGVAIIAVVYLPILSLIGTEGKLFRPMAITVLLALLGSFIFSLTVVPVLTSYLVRARDGAHEPWLVRHTQAIYNYTLMRAMRRKWVTLSVAAVWLAGAAFMSTRLGAEFVPQLDEGDLLIEARRLPGGALTESVAMDGRLEAALREIPEVDHVISRAGAPEVATDPMGMEQSDVYVTLKDRETWRHGLTKEDLSKQVAEVMERATPEIGGAVSQPIQMRTNELVAGVRSDIAAQIYGPDLATLAQLGERVAEAIRKVPGAVDVRVEAVAGLSYLTITPDRAKLARYGLTVQDINQLTETISVGHEVGAVLEGERRFSLVIKTHHAFAGDLDALRTLPLKSVTNQIVPLADVAELKLSKGPAEISREKQSRRLTVELNVRDRDLVSVVGDAQAAVARLDLPTGYHVEWGGQFQHYAQAKRRLLLVVPLALTLIGFLLWLALGTTRPAAIIFLNVPFAIIGGVVALWLRSIPFSISAGIGFIALFGVAVLNGLVMVTFAQELEAKGASHVEAIGKAADMRLRPVLMTALVASLGFIPMALSTAPGSEVQRPLATVVIGGLLSATLLTLLVLPVVYSYFGRSKAESPSETGAPNNL